MSVQGFGVSGSGLGGFWGLVRFWQGVSGFLCLTLQALLSRLARLADSYFACTTLNPKPLHPKTLYMLLGLKFVGKVYSRGLINIQRNGLFRRGPPAIPGLSA